LEKSNGQSKKHLKDLKLSNQQESARTKASNADMTACLPLQDSDIGRIYIKGYLYPISYPKIAKKDIPLSFF
jgi:hypothetical protein